MLGKCLCYYKKCLNMFRVAVWLLQMYAHVRDDMLLDGRDLLE